MDRTYEVTVKLMIDSKDEKMANQIVHDALKDMCEHRNMSAFVYDDIQYVGTKIK